ncbi:circadian clock KaiB family protein [Prochlorothrix hollandica]|uniref:KaiB domain-containing protein n=1 Tax=Prochlorothrix hollandica PCC 9006 = CALU 1027 TaxID=317619 RepID=A0A0M2Q3F0_PROHO|nr:circadian clock KaiB family protein [Prochlorothrix hollandica]KKJ01122.1 hypothetical protein PROH_01625 [Prochlorothrix hollandica PCC 9006 = CALU 1027]
MLPLPPSYKAIVLFTPGGDLVYSIDPSRRQHWHLDLCIAIQEVWELPEPPHFLIPTYTATVDCYCDPQTQSNRIYAEAYGPTFRHRHWLNALFGLDNNPWHCLPSPQGQGDGTVMAAYRHQFPQLWQRRDWVLALDQLPQVYPSPPASPLDLWPDLPGQSNPAYHSLLPPGEQGYVLRLFVSGHGAGTVEILQRLYGFLEEYVSVPYTLKVVDVLTYPEQGETSQVNAIPTLIRVWPEPLYRVVGHFERWEQLAQLFHP